MRSGAFGLALAVLAFAGGCAEKSPLDRAGLTLPRPKLGWSVAQANRVVVPGVALAAWEGPNGASFVAYRTLPVPGEPHPTDALGLELANRWTNLVGAKVLSRERVEVDGRPSVFVTAVAPGTGDAWLPSGAGAPAAPPGVAIVPTRRVLVAVPLPTMVLNLLWHVPDDKADQLDPIVADVLKDSRIDAAIAPTSAY